MRTPQGTVVGDDGRETGGMSERLLIFTYANRRYELFVLPFVHFALRNNAGAHVEIFLEDSAAFHRDCAAGIEVLAATFPGRFTLRQSEVARAAPGTIPGAIRFLETPWRKADYVYIGDIDILVFEDILAVHLELMRVHGIPYSNIIRKGSIERGYPKLSGLHFAPYALQYPVVPPDLDLTAENDEHVLYNIMRDKGVLVREEFAERPICGIHMSPNRDPAGRTSGPMAALYTTEGALRWPKAAYHPLFLEQIREEAFLRLFPELDLGMKFRLLAVEGLATRRTRQLHRLAGSFLVDKRLQVGTGPIERSKAIGGIESALAAGEIERADALSSSACQIWPELARAWELRARALLQNGDIGLGVEALLHLADLPGGAQRIVDAGIVATYGDRIAQVPLGGEELLALLHADGVLARPPVTAS